MMRRTLIGVALTVLTGCASVKVPTSYSETLDEYRAMSARLDRIAAPLLKAGMGLCSHSAPSVGAGYHNLADYPEHLRPVAESHWGLGEADVVLYVRAGSAADMDGLKFGDSAPQDRPQGETACDYGTQVRIQPNKNAFANGQDIIVTSSLLRAVDDLALSLIVGHELAHNILGEQEDMDIAEREAQADHWSVFLLARAGLDYSKAIRTFAATAPPHGARMAIGAVQKARFAAFRTSVARVKALEKAGQPLTP